MKKAALPAYILLVTGWLACLLLDSNLSTSLAAPGFSALPALTTHSELRNNKLVMISQGSITEIYNYNNACTVHGSIIYGNTVFICAFPNVNQSSLLVKGY